MRDVKFRVFPGTGAATPSWEHALLDEFLLVTPVFVYELKRFGVIPPIHIMNEILSTGEYDAGMGGACEWRSFEISFNEYEELVLELKTNPDHIIIEDEELKRNVKLGDINERIGGLPGFIAYYMIDCGEGVVTTVSVFEDQAGADQSNAVAAEWVQENVLPNYSISAPQITAGKCKLSSVHNIRIQTK